MGYKREEFYSPNFNYLSLCVPEDYDLLQSAFARHMKGESVPPYEYLLVTRQGKRINAIITTKLIDYKGEKAILGIVTDITERKKAEIELKENHDKLELMNEKLRVVGSLARHDLRNKLCAATANAYLLRKKYANQADILDDVSKMEKACNDIEAILDFARVYEQLGTEALTYVDVEKSLDEALELFSGHLELDVINDCRGLTLLADSFLKQMFYNLIHNSLKHGKKVTKVKVHYEKVDPNNLYVVYEDNGFGIPSENKTSLFKEGFSTGGSSGHGLFLINQMMGIYGWTIQEDGEPGKGAKFTITIPRINKKGEENFQIVS